MSATKKVVAIAVLASAGFWAWKQASTNATREQTSAASTTNAKPATTNAQPSSDSLPAQAVLKINPRVASSTPAGGTASAAKTIAASPLLAAYIAGKDLPGLYAQVSNRDDVEAVGLRLKLLKRCAKKTDDDAAKKPDLSREGKRAKFVADIPETSPDRALRIAAYDEINQDACGSLSTLTATKADIAALQARALELKDPSTVIEDLDCSLVKNREAQPSSRRAATLTPEQFAQLTDVIASKDPYAASPAVGLLANTFGNGKVVWADTGEPIDFSLIFNLARLLPCELGADCQNNVRRACAFENKCAASNYTDHLAYYQLSPYGAQQVELYRQRFMQMISNKDFSALRFELGEQDLSRNVTASSFHPCGR
jgi:hypothetical protein